MYTERSQLRACIINWIITNETAAWDIIHVPEHSLERVDARPRQPRHSMVRVCDACRSGFAERAGRAADAIPAAEIGTGEGSPAISAAEVDAAELLAALSSEEVVWTEKGDGGGGGDEGGDGDRGRRVGGSDGGRFREAWEFGGA